MIGKKVLKCTSSEIRAGAQKYVEAIIHILEKMDKHTGPFEFGKEVVFMGYAVGVVAGKMSDVGLEGFTMVLQGVEMSMVLEKRKEKMQYAVWDKDGELHTSDEMFKVDKEGGES